MQQNVLSLRMADSSLYVKYLALSSATGGRYFLTPVYDNGKVVDPWRFTSEAEALGFAISEHPTTRVTRVSGGGRKMKSRSRYAYVS